MGTHQRALRAPRSCTKTHLSSSELLQTKSRYLPRDTALGTDMLLPSRLSLEERLLPTVLP